MFAANGHALEQNESAHDTAATCANLLASGGYRNAVKQAFELGIVASPAEVMPLEEFYLQLKNAEAAPPPNLREVLTNTRQHQFAIDAMSERELRQFYTNAVNTLYVRIANYWAVQEVRTQVGPVMNRALETTLTRVLAQYFSPWRLEDKDLRPESAREHFRQKKWIMLPWQKIASFVTEWQSHSGETKFSSMEFSKFWDARAPSYGLNHDVYQRLYLALSRGPDAPACCLSEPGCVACPHNRRWRIKRP